MQSLPALSPLTFELPSQRHSPIAWAAPNRSFSRGAADYVDAVAVETVAVQVMPAANEPSMLWRTRAQAAVQLYASIYRDEQRPSVTLHVIA
jgi:hypothetical protein